MYKINGVLMTKVALYNLGCKVNSYEIDVMQQNLAENGYLIVPFDEVADIYIVNTCTVTNVADAKSRKMLHRARRMNPDAIVVAVGCFVQVEEDVLKDTSINLAIGNNKKNELVPILNGYIKNHPSEPKKTIIDINRETTYEEMTLKRITGHTRAFVKIQDGCNQFCSFCIIPYARGRVRSRSESSIIEELTELVNAGCREVVLTGINLSSYGCDFDDKKTLANLLTRLSDIPGLERIRLGSLEPQIITSDFVQKIAGLPKVCPHFHLSLQSGCDTVLKRMNRHYSTADYLAKVEMIRTEYRNKYGNEPAITTDIIVGFPGETETEFAETEDFIRLAKFSEIHIFKYSKRKGTKAAVMPDQLPMATKKARSERLHELSELLAKNYRDSFLGKSITIILEEEKEIGKIGYGLGYTAEYVRVAIPITDFPEEKIKSGLIVSATITDYLTSEIMLARLP